MPAVVTQEGQIHLLTDLLTGTTPVSTSWLLDLWTGAHTPSVTDTRNTYVAGGLIATFTGYIQKTLTRTTTAGTWVVSPTPSGTTLNTQGNAKATYAGTIQWSATSAQTIVGHLLTDSGGSYSVLAERWGTAISLTNPSTLTLTPVLELGASAGAIVAP